MPDRTDWNDQERHDEPPDHEEHPLRWAPENPPEEQRLRADEPKPPSEPSDGGPELPPAPEPPLPSWERLDEIGFKDALVRSLREILIAPGRTFARMPKTGVLTRPLLFLALLFTAAAVVGALLGLVVPDLSRYQGLSKQLGTPINPQAASLCAIVLAPAIALVAVFIQAGIIHLFLLLFSGTRYTFETTLRTVAYTSGATTLFTAIPWCGGPVASIWFLVVTIIGLTETQETTTGRAAAAVLTPTVIILLCCGCALVANHFLGAELANDPIESLFRQPL